MNQTCEKCGREHTMLVNGKCRKCGGWQALGPGLTEEFIKREEIKPCTVDAAEGVKDTATKSQKAWMKQSKSEVIDYVTKPDPVTPIGVDYYTCFDEAWAVCRKQLSEGKGWERHGQAKPFKEQDSFCMVRSAGIGGPMYQVMKKAREMLKFTDRAAQIRELAGVVNYALMAMMLLMEQDEFAIRDSRTTNQEKSYED